MQQTRECIDTADVTDDLAELDLAPLAQEGIAEEHRVYPLGVHADHKRPN